ncbi:MULTISPECIES: MFS transporter [Pseudomonas]|uniref:MFS transporter n=1 Tax=Pseudomonas TaxID=286 RepID=UPI000F578FE0|nr:MULTISPECIES: MFS transporter [Pseudomonas]AZF10308.1 putative inner membrane efflux protein [Pseudomonas sp. R2-37-08W]AZF15526.1 putative inner membrane efflux protein [Pseudomonas sp. R3-18-08]AZF20839.1 putative inner membrane efflux protein [Pseudomonas sp. R3-52-08]AZF26170.1 putative inner membrane efflux protein [Pseudomonas sp. R2-60-08W]AZF31535.1 putative inner membrane efflux protein [Pseudomonas sp. R4-35-07]
MPFTDSKRRWLILAIISSALLLIVIDMTVLYTALPTLTRELGATASQKLWIINIYALVAAGLLLGMGTLGDRLGHKRLFIGGLGVFGLFSLIAAFSPSASVLIGARGFLAVGAAMMMPATLALVRLTFTDPREQAMAFGIWASVASGGAAFGPVVGGLLLEHFWWGSVFLINVPIVLLALLLAATVIPDHPGNAQRRWDWLGSLQVMIGLISVAYAVKELGKRHPSFEAMLIALVLGTLFLTLFIRRQRRADQPMLDLTLFRASGFRNAVISAVVSAAALIGMELVFSQRLQLVLGLSPLEAALFILPLPLGSFVAGPLAGHYLPRLGEQRMLFWTLLLSAAAMLTYLLAHNAAAPVQIVSLALLGFTMGAALTAASSTIMLSVPADKAGMAASLEEVSFELGGAAGVTLAGSLLSAIYTYSASQTIAPWLALNPMIFESLDDALVVAATSSPEHVTMLTELARAAFDAGFVAVLAACAALLLMAALLVRPRKLLS